MLIRHDYNGSIMGGDYFGIALSTDLITMVPCDGLWWVWCVVDDAGEVDHTGPVDEDVWRPQHLHCWLWLRNCVVSACPDLTSPN